MDNEQKLKGAEKFEYLRHFVSLRGKPTQRFYDPINFLEPESCINVDDSKLSVEILKSDETTESTVHG